MPPDRHPGLKGLYLMPSKCRVAHLDEPFVCIKHSVGTAAALSFDDRVLVFSAVSHDHQPFVTFILFLSNHWKALLRKPRVLFDGVLVVYNLRLCFLPF